VQAASFIHRGSASPVEDCYKAGCMRRALNPLSRGREMGRAKKRKSRSFGFLRCASVAQDDSRVCVERALRGFAAWTIFFLLFDCDGAGVETSTSLRRG
jgi:hypothetical protein